MFWDNVAIVYDIFVNIINRKTHEKLKLIIQEMINENEELLKLYEDIHSKISQGNMIYSRLDKLKKKVN